MWCDVRKDRIRGHVLVTCLRNLECGGCIFFLAGPSVLWSNWQDNVISQHCVRGVLKGVGVHFAVSSPSFHISFPKLLVLNLTLPNKCDSFLHLREIWSASCSYRLSEWNLQRKEKTWPHLYDRKLKWTCEHLTLIYLFFYFETFQSVNHSNVVVSL